MSMPAKIGIKSYRYIIIPAFMQAHEKCVMKINVQLEENYIAVMQKNCSIEGRTLLRLY